MKRILSVAAVLVAAPCRAHLPSSSTLTLDFTAAQRVGLWSVPLVVLDDAWLVDTNADGTLSDAEWVAAKALITAEMFAGLHFSSTSKPAVLRISDISVDSSSAVPRVEVRFSLPQDVSGSQMKITCRLLAWFDPLHRVLISRKD